MRKSWLIVGAVGLFIAGRPSIAGEPIALKVLYAGNPASEREKDFAAFLAKSFAKVSTTDYRTFKEGDASGYDVVILDWTSVYPRDDQGKITQAPAGTNSRVILPTPPKLSSSFDRPTIMIGGAGDRATVSSQLKIDWLCLCLNEAAHGVVSSHEVFQKPLKVDLQFEDAAVPPEYRHYPGGEKLGDTIKVWKVQTKKFPEIDPGMVSDPYGFADSPDAEVISSGLNGKGPDSVALGRHGNFFLWGFSGSPADMTPEARKCFVNSICYIKKFDGQKPFVKKTSSGREWSLVYAGYMEQFANQDFVKTMFPEDVRKRLGKDPAKYVSYYKENLEYLIPAQSGFAVDEDVKGLGLSNRKVELLEQCVALLERGERTDTAFRILKRYTTESFGDAQRWRSWLRENRNRIFFTDAGGFKFLVAPDSLVKP